MAENKKKTSSNSNKKGTQETKKDTINSSVETLSELPQKKQKNGDSVPQKTQKKPIEERKFSQSETTLKSTPSSKASSSSGKGKKKKAKDAESRILRISTAKDAPFNYAEAYRALRTNINFIASTEDTKSIVVTSAVPKESKSNCAVNIAVSLATEGKKVILVDCDLRKPVIHSYLKMGRHREGLTEVLAGKAELEDCISKFKDIKISVLPAGAVPPNPSELLSQKKMKSLIKALEQNFDYVIIDAPPVSVVTDAAIISSYVDGAILVVRSKFASIEAIQLAKKRLDDVNAKILGVVVTRYDAKRSTKNTGYSYSYDYHYGEE